MARESRIVIPKNLLEGVAQIEATRLPSDELKEQAIKGARIAEEVASDFFAALKVVEASGEQRIELSHQIAAQFRHVQVENGVCVVRFGHNKSNPPAEKYHPGGGISSGLEIAVIEDRPNSVGWKWEAMGIAIRSMGDAVYVECLGGDNYRRMVDVLRNQGDEIDITDNKLTPLSKLERVISTCFTPEEIHQDGGIVQALIDQAARNLIAIEKPE